MGAVLASKNSFCEADPESLPELDTESGILEAEDVAALRDRLPTRLENHTWALAFSTSRDGFSLAQLYRKMQLVDSVVLMVIQVRPFICPQPILLSYLPFIYLFTHNLAPILHPSSTCHSTTCAPAPCPPPVHHLSSTRQLSSTCPPPVPPGRGPSGVRRPVVGASPGHTLLQHHHH